MRTSTRPAPLKCGDAKRGVRRAEHRVLRVQHQVENDLLQLAAIAVNARQVRIEVGLDANLRGLELVFEQSDACRAAVRSDRRW